MSYISIFLIIFIIIAAWYAWRYYKLRREVDKYASNIRQHPDQSFTEIKELENLSGSIASIISTFDV